jgi:hypothetical protein
MEVHFIKKISLYLKIIKKKAVLNNKIALKKMKKRMNIEKMFNLN